MAYQSTTYVQTRAGEGKVSGTTLTANGEPLFGQASGAVVNAYWSFNNVRIPKGATIVSAVISWVPNTSYTDKTTLVTFKVVDQDSPSNPANYAAWAAFSWMGTVVNATITANWTGGTRLDSPDISPIISAAVNRAGWAIGNTIIVGAFDNGTANNHNRGVESLAGDAANCPILTVVFTSETFYVNHCLIGADIGYWNTPSSYAASLWMGQFGGRSLQSHRRYLALPIPQGTQILTAQEFIYCTGATDHSTLAYDAYCNDVDDAVSPTTYAQGDALALTTATISFSPGNIAAYAPITYGEITACVQEVFDRAGWASGNDLQTVTRYKSGATGPFTSYAAFPSNLYYRAYLPRLEITFAAPAAGGLIAMKSIF